VDLVRYSYPPLSPPAPGPLGSPVADLKNLAAMKLAAIARRGLRRDFWDLHAICEAGMSLEDACRGYRARFGKTQADLYHVIRALTYFDDAEKEPALPAGLTPDHWDRIRAFFVTSTPPLLHALRDDP